MADQMKGRVQTNQVDNNITIWLLQSVHYQGQTGHWEVRESSQTAGSAQDGNHISISDIIYSHGRTITGDSMALRLAWL